LGLVINTIAHWLYKSIPIPKNPTYSYKDVTIMLNGRSASAEGSNVGIHGGAGGDKGADSLWIPGLTAVEVDRSVKVRRDSRKRSQLILANIGHFLVPLRGYGTVQPDITRRPEADE
jgi:hypothetical protein